MVRKPESGNGEWAEPATCGNQALSQGTGPHRADTVTGLLVSVRDAGEASIAVGAGVDLIDIKEPNRGSLGRADLQSIKKIRSLVCGRAPLSVALGELNEYELSQANLRAFTDGIDYAKIGLAGCGNLPDWQSRLREAYASLRPSTSPVAVIYADWRSAQAPSPPDLLTAATESQCRWILVDTHNKSSGGLLDHMPLTLLRSLVNQCRMRSCHVVLAGSLTLDTILVARSLRPDYVAVRGAVCAGDRGKQIDEHKLCQLVRMLAARPVESRIGSAE